MKICSLKRINICSVNDDGNDSNTDDNKKTEHKDPAEENKHEQTHIPSMMVCGCQVCPPLKIEVYLGYRNSRGKKSNIFLARP